METVPVSQYHLESGSGDRLADLQSDAGDEAREGHFQAGDRALLIDRKGRRYLVKLDGNGTFHSHVGTLAHGEIIGQDQGVWVRTSLGQVLLAVKPTLSDFVLEMPRSSQVIYPKDLGNILVMADIFPGATVVEGGLGSGALTATLLRAVGIAGRVITYEMREDMGRGGPEEHKGALS